MDFVDHVFYINLGKREDRKNLVLKELLKVFDESKITRFEAIYNEKGGVGCSQSHIGVLELAKSQNYKNVLIVEDDMQWINFDKSLNHLIQLQKKDYDVILLGGYYEKFDSVTSKIYECQARTALIVKQHYYDTLLDNYKTGLEKLLISYEKQFRGDQYWKQLQRKDNWYIVRPRMCQQRESYSDIEKKKVNYNCIIF